MTGFVTPHQPTKEELVACVSCGLCLPHCPTYRLTGREGDSPRGRIAALTAVSDGLLEMDKTLDETLSFCLGCRACEAVCPSLVPYGRILEGARAELAVQRPSTGRRLRRVALGRLIAMPSFMRLVTVAAGLLQRMGAAVLLPKNLRRGIAGLRPLDLKRAALATGDPEGAVRGTVGLLTGCVMEPWFPAVHRAVIDLLRRGGYRVVVPDSQTCCGALAAHDGHIDDAVLLAERNLVAFEGFDVVVSDAAGCAAFLKEYGELCADDSGFAERAVDATDLVARLIGDRVLPSLDPRGIRVAVQDPCHLRHAQRIFDAPRSILRAAGFVPVEIGFDGLCCGAAGVYSILRPEDSQRLGMNKADQVRRSGARIVASANPGCEMQLRAYLGDDYRIAHPLELYAEALVGGRTD